MTKPVSCPTCGDVFEGHTAVGVAAVERAKPTPGSVLLCVNCGEILVLGDDWQAHAMTEQEAMVLPAEAVELLAKIENARQTVARRNQRNPFGRNAGRRS